MYCPKCSTSIHLDKECMETDMFFNKSKWPIPPEGFFQCKGCGLSRPEVWWDSLQMDINTEITFSNFKEETEEELPDEISGYCESPWNG